MEHSDSIIDWPAAVAAGLVERSEMADFSRALVARANGSWSMDVGHLSETQKMSLARVIDWHLERTRQQ